MASTAVNSRKNAATSVEDLQDDVHALQADMSRLTHRVVELLGDTGEQAVKDAKGKARQVKKKVDGALADASSRAEDVANSLEETVQARPFAAIGLAVALGFLFGAVWRR